MVQYKLDKKGNLFQGWTFGFSSSKIHSRSLYFKLDVQALFMLIQTHILRSKQHPCRTWTWVRPTSSNGPDNQLNPHRSCRSHSWQNCQWTTFCPVYSEKNSFFLWPNLIIREGSRDLIGHSLFCRCSLTKEWVFIAQPKPHNISLQHYPSVMLQQPQAFKVPHWFPR